MADISKAMDTLSEMLSTSEGKENLESIMNSFTSGSSGSSNSSATTGSTQSPVSMDSMMKIKNVMDEIQNDNDSRANLLMALKPFLNQSRLGRIDETIGLLRLAKIPNIIKTVRK